MPKHQCKIEKLIAELCPEGVEWKTLDEVCISIIAGDDLAKKYLISANLQLLQKQPPSP